MCAACDQLEVSELSLQQNSVTVDTSCNEDAESKFEDDISSRHC